MEQSMKNIIITLLAALTYGCSLTEPLSDAKTHTQKEVVHIQKPQPPRVIQIRQEHPQHQGMVIHDGILHRIGTTQGSKHQREGLQCTSLL